MNSHLLALIKLCDKYNCSIELKVCISGISATFETNRGEVYKSISFYIDRNHPQQWSRLEQALKDLTV